MTHQDIPLCKFVGCSRTAYSEFRLRLILLSGLHQLSSFFLRMVHLEQLLSDNLCLVDNNSCIHRVQVEEEDCIKEMMDEVGNMDWVLGPVLQNSDLQKENQDQENAVHQSLDIQRVYRMVWLVLSC